MCYLVCLFSTSCVFFGGNRNGAIDCLGRCHLESYRCRSYGGTYKLVVACWDQWRVPIEESLDLVHKKSLKSYSPSPKKTLSPSMKI